MGRLGVQHGRPWPTMAAWPLATNSGWPLTIMFDRGPSWLAVVVGGFLGGKLKHVFKHAKPSSIDFARRVLRFLLQYSLVLSTNIHAKTTTKFEEAEDSKEQICGGGVERICGVGGTQGRDQCNRRRQCQSDARGSRQNYSKTDEENERCRRRKAQRGLESPKSKKRAKDSSAEAPPMHSENDEQPAKKSTANRD